MAAKLTPEQLKGLIRAGYVYRNGDEHHLTPQGREALARAGVNSGGRTPAGRRALKSRSACLSDIPREKHICLRCLLRARKPDHLLLSFPYPSATRHALSVCKPSRDNGDIPGVRRAARSALQAMAGRGTPRADAGASGVVKAEPLPLHALPPGPAQAPRRKPAGEWWSYLCGDAAPSGRRSARWVMTRC